jgi:hypothetical protein
MSGSGSVSGSEFKLQLARYSRHHYRKLKLEL